MIKNSTTLYINSKKYTVVKQVDNKYYTTEKERIFLEEKIKHFEKILGDE